MIVTVQCEPRGTMPRLDMAFHVPEGVMPMPEQGEVGIF